MDTISAQRPSDSELEEKFGMAKKSPTDKKKEIVELTPETLKIADAILTVSAGKLGTIILVHTVKDKEIYTAGQILNGKIVKVWAAHENRVESSRHLPRAIRMIGSWIGDNGGDEFSNGPTAKKSSTK